MAIFRLKFKCVECGHVFFQQVVEKCPRCDSPKLTLAREEAKDLEQAPVRKEIAAATLEFAPGEETPREKFLKIKARQRLESAEKMARERGRE